MNLGLSGKVALVLAAGGGLGRAIATTLAREGVAVAVSDLNSSALDETVSQITAGGGRAFGRVADLSERIKLESLVADASRKIGEIDILVNNSGGPPPTPAAGVSAELWKKHFDAMVLSLIAITDLTLPAMRRRKWGRVITSSSSGVIAPIPNLGLSNALRSTLVGWSKTLAREVADQGITVNMVVPGRIATDRIRELDTSRGAREGKSIDQVVAESIQSIPMRRYGSPQEYADVVAFLASERASYVTGSIVRVDGGMLVNV
jgi:3-oxoacyl-[acyl-carrier protein] reductase